MGILNKLLVAKKDQQNDRSDYGSLLMPPSAEASAILAAMTDEEKNNFVDLLRTLQEWYDCGSEEGPVSFHPEARAHIWGTALAKIADHYYSINCHNKALFFSSTAYNLSQHPFFAYNVAMLSVAAGDLKSALTLLQTFLAHYQDMLTNARMRLVSPEITAEELEDMAKSARAKLAWIKSQLE
jgi:tetratricopeptide (TPR) repeat protein